MDNGLQGLELLERLLAIATVGDRAAERGAKGGVERGMARAAVRAPGRLQQRDRRAAGRAWRRDACGGQLPAPLLADPVAAPALFSRYVNLNGEAKLLQPLPDHAAHDLDRRAAGERRHQQHARL